MRAQCDKIGGLKDSLSSSFQKLDAANEDSYMDSQWADTQALKRSFQGLNDIKWGPGKRL